MLANKNSRLSGIMLVLAAFCVLAYLGYLLLLHPQFYDPDSYYNMAITGFTKDFGPGYGFRWAQLSALKEHFADRDLILHMLCIPFAYCGGVSVLSGKYAVISFAALFILVYIMILKKYLPDKAAALFLVLPFLSTVFTTYVLQLRSVTLANILAMICIFSLINRKYIWVLIVSTLYPLTHISFWVLMPLALICETLRLFLNKEFFLKNLYAVLLGVTAGCLLHPDIPNFLFNAYLVCVRIPLDMLSGNRLGLSGELGAMSLQRTLIENYAMVFGVAIILRTAYLAKTRLTFTSAVWGAVSLACILSAFAGLRLWYQANVIFFIFMASFISDLMRRNIWREIILKLKVPLVLFSLCVPFITADNSARLGGLLDFLAARNAHFESIGTWMKGNIPEGETIYHSYFDDSSYFIFADPNNNYFNTSDPVFMRYSFPKEFALIDDLCMGRVGNPHEALKRILKVRYGYLRKSEPFYRQITDDKSHFHILYEDGQGAVFKLRE